MSSKQNYQNTGLGLSAPCHIPAYINMCTEKRNFMNEDMLRVGVITSTHGIKGEVKVFPTTDDPARFKKLKECLKTKESICTSIQKGFDVRNENLRKTFTAS